MEYTTKEKNPKAPLISGIHQTHSKQQFSQKTSHVVCVSFVSCLCLLCFTYRYCTDQHWTWCMKQLNARKAKPNTVAHRSAGFLKVSAVFGSSSSTRSQQQEGCRGSKRCAVLLKLCAVLSKRSAMFKQTYVPGMHWYGNSGLMLRVNPPGLTLKKKNFHFYRFL